MRDEGTLENKPKIGRPPKQSEETKEMMIAAVQDDRTLYSSLPNRRQKVFLLNSLIVLGCSQYGFCIYCLRLNVNPIF